MITTQTAGKAILNTFDGVAVNNLAVLVKYTYGGDLNLSGNINADDYFIIDKGFAQGSTLAANGDLNFDGKINADDYFVIDRGFASQGTPLSATPASAVPADPPFQASAPIEDSAAADQGSNVFAKARRATERAALFSDQSVLQ